MESGAETGVCDKAIEAFERFEQSINSASSLQSTIVKGLQDQLERYCQWAGNLGAFHREDDSRSLGYRLRNASPIAQRLRELLSELIGSLDNIASEWIWDEYSDPITPDDSLPAPVAKFAHETIDTASNDSDSDDEALLRGLVGVTTSREANKSWIISGISDTITRLFKMSAALAKSTVTDRYAKAEASARIKLSTCYDISHVREKFATRQVDDWLLERLGTAITKRRQFLIYCQSHREKLARNSERQSEIGAAATENVQESGKRLDGITGAKTQYTRPSMVQTTASTLGPINLDAVDDGFDDVRSYSTMATSVGDFNADALKVPPLTDFTKPGEHFECPFCRTIKCFNGPLAWKRHVFADIRPYVCTFRSCGLLMFDSKHAWMEHEMQHHRRIWICHACKQNDFCSEEALQQHFNKTHATNLASKTIQVMTGSQTAEAIMASECPLCDWEPNLRNQNPDIRFATNISVTTRQFMKHLAKHLLQLALFALPRNVSDDDETASSAAARVQSLSSGHREMVNGGTLKSLSSSANVLSEEGFTSSPTHPSEHFCGVAACGKRFSRASDLARHQRTFHKASEKWYQCAEHTCQYSSSRLDHVRQHCQNMHPHMLGREWYQAVSPKLIAYTGDDRVPSLPLPGEYKTKPQEALTESNFMALESRHAQKDKDEKASTWLADLQHSQEPPLVSHGSNEEQSASNLLPSSLSSSSVFTTSDARTSLEPGFLSVQGRSLEGSSSTQLLFSLGSLDAGTPGPTNARSVQAQDTLVSKRQSTQSISGDDEDVDNDDKDYYVVEKILAHRMSDPSTDAGEETTVLYQVKWVDYPEPTWETITNLDRAVVEEYHALHQQSDPGNVVLQNDLPRLQPESALSPVISATTSDKLKESEVKTSLIIRDHTTDQLCPEGDEYLLREIDQDGELKVSGAGYLQGRRRYNCRTFTLPDRGEKLFMLATECARVLRYRDSSLLFNQNRSLFKIVANQAEKDSLIQQEILPYSYRSRQIAIVTARSMFRQFGSRLIHDGRRVRDDYWETKARNQGFTEYDPAGAKHPRSGHEPLQPSQGQDQLYERLPTGALDLPLSNNPTIPRIGDMPPPPLPPTFEDSHLPHPRDKQPEQADQADHSASSTYQHDSSPLDEVNRGLCPIPTCGRHVKDLKAHMLTHQNERPEKCPIPTCVYHIKGFARKYDKNRHSLTHYKGELVCGFCPRNGSDSEKTFNRADVFKRHLTSVHGVEQTPPNARKKTPIDPEKRPNDAAREVSGACSTCNSTFASAQDFYEHLDDCVLRIVQQADPSEAINEKLLRSVAEDELAQET